MLLIIFLKLHRPSDFGVIAVDAKPSDFGVFYILYTEPPILEVFAVGADSPKSE